MECVVPGRSSSKKFLSARKIISLESPNTTLTCQHRAPPVHAVGRSPASVREHPVYLTAEAPTPTHQLSKHVLVASPFIL
jgi:hypothetical protein